MYKTAEMKVIVISLIAQRREVNGAKERYGE